MHYTCTLTVGLDHLLLRPSLPGHFNKSRHGITTDDMCNDNASFFNRANNNAQDLAVMRHFIVYINNNTLSYINTSCNL